VASEEKVDLMTLCYDLPTSVIGDLLGLPRADRAMVHQWTVEIAENLHLPGGPDAVVGAYQAHAEFQAYVDGMLAEYRSTGSSPSLLVEQCMGAERGDRLTSRELTAMFIVLTFGGSETTTNLISI